MNISKLAGLQEPGPAIFSFLIFIMLIILLIIDKKKHFTARSKSARYTQKQMIWTGIIVVIFCLLVVIISGSYK